MPEGQLTPQGAWCGACPAPPLSSHWVWDTLGRARLETISEGGPVEGHPPTVLPAAGATSLFLKRGSGQHIMFVYHRDRHLPGPRQLHLYCVNTLLISV